MNPSLATVYDATSDLVLPSSVNSGNLTLSRGTSTTARTFNFQDLYVAGNLTLTGAVNVNATSVYVGGSLTIDEHDHTTVSDSLGHGVRGRHRRQQSVTGRVNLTTSVGLHREAR